MPIAFELHQGLLCVFTNCQTYSKYCFTCAYTKVLRLQTTKANAIIQVHRLRVYVFTILRLLMAQIERM